MYHVATILGAGYESAPFESCLLTVDMSNPLGYFRSYKPWRKPRHSAGRLRSFQ